MKRNYKYCIGEKVKNKYGDYFEILQQTTDNRGGSAYICKCNKNHIFFKRQTKIYTSCPYCTNRIIEKGVNDISTTNYELFNMLIDKDFEYSHCETSQEKTDWKCSTCNNIIHNRTPYSILERGLCCPSCSDGISYGEKFIYNLLNEIGVDFVYQLSSKKVDWCDKYKYDFYIPCVDCIIEVMGLQHYKDCSWSTYEETHKNDLFKKKLALNNVKYYIELDARYSNLNYIKQSILRSKLDDILSLFLYHISWKKIHKKSLSSILDTIVDKYNNVTKDINDLSDMTGLSNVTIVRYLKNANELRLCDYDTKNKKIDTLNKNHSMNSERYSKPVMCLNDGNVFRNAKIAQSISDELYNKHLDSRNISTVCHGKEKATKGFRFKFIPRSEFNRIKEEIPEKAFGDYFFLLDQEEFA